MTGASAEEAGRMNRAAKTELGTSALFAADGTLLAASKQGEHVVLFKSSDLGRHWSSPIRVNAVPEAISADGENRPKLALAADGALLVAWTHPLAEPYSGAVRLARSTDGGASFSPPLTVHRDRQEITHRFESLIVGGDGRVYLAWIDKRDLERAKREQAAYRGAAIYVAVSNDGGRSFQPEVKVADHSCECCRIAAALDGDGAPLLLFRHVFEPNERDFALAKLGADGTPRSFARATFERWRVDGCPHHGPSLAVAADGTRHAIWFNVVEGEGKTFHGRLHEGRVEGQRIVAGAQASHADIIVGGRRVVLAWKEFDGERTLIRAEISTDGGQSFAPLTLAETTGASDQPRLLSRGEEVFLFWRSENEGMRLIPVRPRDVR
ncbi:MAG: hypothetical protein CVU17_07280 [Betaproteobacteria bacterium HGW-Betaproteobacteria-11]|nr:MAG: hypothetical protein CVU17_07280 [Betaproteobacteria bacterium HGW-Betaproteobacteria-11]